MAAREIERRFDAALGAIVVTIEDDLGHRPVYTIHVDAEHDACPACGTRIPRDAAGEVDVEAFIQARRAEADARCERLSRKFEKHGAARKAAEGTGDAPDPSGKT